ncbi:MAG TPA: HTTM domain-containing protein [Polyangiaceae bacterium]
MVAATPPLSELSSPSTKTRRMLGSLPRGAWQFVRDSWLSIDLRALGAFRIAFGLSLIGNLVDHTRGDHLVAFFTNAGVMPNYLALQAPIQPRAWSLLFGFSTPGEVAIAFSVIFAVYVLYTLGWKTRLMQVLVVICFISLVNRNLLLQDGGSFVTTLLSIWTAFLPLGARYSLDRWLAREVDAEPSGETPPQRTLMGTFRWPDQSPRHVSFVCLALLLQVAVIYGFNAANKTGVTWKTGTAVHYVLWQSGTNTELAAFLRYHEPSWFSPLLTRGTLFFEWMAPFLALTPIFRITARRLLIVSMLLFHTGITLIMSLGPFAWAMMAYSALLLGPRDFAWLEPKARRLANAIEAAIERRPLLARWRAMLEAKRVRRRACAAEPPESAAPGRWPTRRRVARLLVREGAALVLFAAMLTEVTSANAAMPKHLRIEKRPDWMNELLFYLRVYQTWGMFSSDPPLDSGTVVIDATLADGTHLDPLTGSPPDLEAPLHGPWLQGHDWSEYLFYYPWDRHRQYRDGLRDFAARKDESWPQEKRIRSFNLYWVNAMSPAPGSVEPHDLKRELLLSYVRR